MTAAKVGHNRSAECDDDGSGGDEEATDEGWRGELFSE
jgi:hypothetical protein